MNFKLALDVLWPRYADELDDSVDSVVSDAPVSLRAE